MFLRYQIFIRHLRYLISSIYRMSDKLEGLGPNVIVMSVSYTHLDVYKRQPQTDGYVRMVLANTLGHFATSAIRFHELPYLLSFQSSKVAEVNQLQNVRRKLLRQFEEITTTLLTAPEPHVKEALLSNILPICHLFGKERTNDIILSHLITYLNDKNSSLRISLIRSITGVSVLLGSVALEQYILPLLTQTLSDSEEAVVISVIQSLISFCKVGLLKSKYFYDIASEIAVLVLHPNFWVREYTMLLLIEMASKLSKPELYCICLLYTSRCV